MFEFFGVIDIGGLNKILNDNFGVTLPEKLLEFGKDLDTLAGFVKKRLADKAEQRGKETREYKQITTFSELDEETQNAILELCNSNPAQLSYFMQPGTPTLLSTLSRCGYTLKEQDYDKFKESFKEFLKKDK